MNPDEDRQRREFRRIGALGSSAVWRAKEKKACEWRRRRTVGAFVSRMHAPGPKLRSLASATVVGYPHRTVDLAHVDRADGLGRSGDLRGCAKDSRNGLGRRSYGRLDHFRDRFGAADELEVAGVDGLDRRVRMLGHELLSIGRDDVVFGPDQRPRRDCLPRWRTGLLAGLVGERWSLRCRDQRGRFGVDAIRKALGDTGIRRVRFDLEVEVGATCDRHRFEDRAGSNPRHAPTRRSRRLRWE
jgi:hypothetical protein